MNRQTFNALCAQYATPEVSGDGLVSWDSGKKCVIPSVRLYGAAVQDGTPTPDAPIMPACNNGVFASRGRNLAAIATVSSGYWLDGSGLQSNPDARFVCLSVNVLPNALYTLSSSLKIYSIWYVNQSGTPVARTRGEAYTTAYKTPDDCVSLRISLYNTSGVADTSAFKWLQCELGDTATPYTPYYDGGQTQAPELWAIPGTEYRDEWNLQTGRGIRRVKKIVLDGTEIKLYQPPNTNGYWHVFPCLDNAATYGVNFVMCSHFLWYAFGSAWGSLFIRASDVSEYFTSLDEINEFLADQNAAGTPVTIIYKLKAPEPFTTSPAKLTMPTGYGQIIQTSGDVPNCPISAKYLTHS